MYIFLWTLTWLYKDFLKTRMSYINEWSIPNDKKLYKTVLYNHFTEIGNGAIIICQFISSIQYR